MRPAIGPKIKAYKVWLEDGEGTTVVFAKNRNQAKTIAMSCDCCEGASYLDISVKRMKALDGLYKGAPEIDWYDPGTRMLLVRDYGWSCVETSWECLFCCAKSHCMWHDVEKEDSE